MVDWGDVAIGATTASVVFTGQFHDLIAGDGAVVDPHWEDEPQSVWAVALVMADDGPWRLTSYDVRRADDGRG